MTEFEEGALVALSVLNASHDQPSMCADVINSMGLTSADCSNLDDFDKVNLRLIMAQSGGLITFKGL